MTRGNSANTLEKKHQENCIKQKGTAKVIIQPNEDNFQHPILLHR